jgi:hypothetical protein
VGRSRFKGDAPRSQLTANLPRSLDDASPQSAATFLHSAVVTTDLRPNPVLVTVANQTATPMPTRRFTPLRRRLTSEAGIVFVLSAGLYLIVAILLDFKYDSFNGDAMARMANGFYVLYSRDPHLAAIGFVWNPLQSILDMAPLLFYHAWTPLATHEFAGSLVSVACMAGAVYQILCALSEWGLGRSARLILTALFALNPMILYYSGTGMSEALYLFTLVATTRYLARWLQHGDIRSLVYSALSLALCYLARNEAVVPAVLGALLVFGSSFVRNGAHTRTRLNVALSDVAVFIAPFVTSLVGWATTSYVITGEAFAQFSSQYGTTAQLQAIGTNGQLYNIGLTSTALSGEIAFEFRALEYLAPLLPLIAVLCLLKAWRRRDPLVLVPLAIVGGGLAFDIFAFFTGSLLWSFRYVIATVPLEILLVGALLARRPEREGAPIARRSGTSFSRGWAAGIATGAIALALVAPSVPTTAEGMWNPHVGWQEMQLLGYSVFHRHLSALERDFGAHYEHIRELSDYISNMHLPNGQIIVDNSSGCIPETIVNSTNPRVFVIPNDRDYQKTLADPLTFGVHYILVPDSSGTNINTSTVRTYPSLYRDGAGFARLVHSFHLGLDCGDFRLYRVIKHPGLSG